MKQLLAETAPASGPLREVVQNILDESILEEEKQRLGKPLLPQKFQPEVPPRSRRGRKMEELLRRFDAFPPQRVDCRADYQNEIRDLYDAAEHEGVEMESGRVS